MPALGSRPSDELVNLYRIVQRTEQKLNNAITDFNKSVSEYQQLQRKSQIKTGDEDSNSNIINSSLSIDFVDHLTSYKIQCMKFEVTLDYIYTLYGKFESDDLSMKINDGNTPSEMQSNAANILEIIKERVLNIQSQLNEHMRSIEEYVDYYNNGIVGYNDDFPGAASIPGSTRSFSVTLFPDDVHSISQTETKIPAVFESEHRHSRQPSHTRIPSLSPTLELTELTNENNIENEVPKKDTTELIANTEYDELLDEFEAEFGKPSTNNQVRNSNNKDISALKPPVIPHIISNEEKKVFQTDSVSVNATESNINHRSNNRKQSSSPTKSIDSLRNDDNDLKNIQSIMEMNKNRQEQLTDVLLKMSSQLKRNAEQFSADLEVDKTVIAEAEDSMSGNLHRMKVESERVKRLTGSSWTTTFFIWGSVLLVCIVFVFMVLFMRLFKK